MEETESQQLLYDFSALIAAVSPVYLISLFIIMTGNQAMYST